MAVYYVQAPEGVYVMKIIFVDDESSLSVAVQQETTEQEAPAVDLEYVLNQAINIIMFP